jgi:hypothetical protein
MMPTILEEATSCVICYKPLEEPDIHSLQCDHCIHRFCEDTYFQLLLANNMDIQCPVCWETLYQKDTTDYLGMQVKYGILLPKHCQTTCLIKSKKKNKRSKKTKNVS